MSLYIHRLWDGVWIGVNNTYEAIGFLGSDTFIYRIGRVEELSLNRR